MVPKKVIGKFGEGRVCNILEKIVEQYGGEVFRNAYIPIGGKRTVEIDVLFLCKRGLFVFEVKTLAGEVVGSLRLNEWTVKGKDKKFKLYNPIKQNGQHVNAVARFLGVSRSYCKNVVVFSTNAELKKVPANTKEHTIVKIGELEEFLPRRMRWQRECFDEMELDRLRELLQKAVKSTVEDRKAHAVDARIAAWKRVRKREREKARRRSKGIE